MGNIERNSRHPLCHRVRKAADKDIHNAAEGTKRQSKNTGQHSPAEAAFHIPQTIRDHTQHRPGVQIIEVPDSQTVEQDFQPHIQINRVYPFLPEHHRIEHHAQAHRLNVGQQAHHILGAKGHSAQDAEEHHLPNRQLSQWYTPAYIRRRPSAPHRRHRWWHILPR